MPTTRRRRAQFSPPPAEPEHFPDAQGASYVPEAPEYPDFQGVPAEELPYVPVPGATPEMDDGADRVAYDFPYAAPEDPDAPLFAPAQDVPEDGGPADEFFLDDNELSEEERRELQQSRWAILTSMGDFVGVIAGTALILLLVMMLVSLLNWVSTDLRQSFTILQRFI